MSDRPIRAAFVRVRDAGRERPATAFAERASDPSDGIDAEVNARV